ncbi:SH3 domain-containing protein [Ponticaulis sp.]|uniref:SH3 domain-containing protein n=1 Tax=Ponticaulis sp. TaxID=2020902 RepID=UPI000B68907F|nr:SH3 domain-containing protein [Ponticaulis sp.]MAI89193.1 hypothetical protein [Ponticaulis sp.]OUY01187.1 MAG: hypothetical protein CBB65_01750 [Hyphomonadaceae bacterium TMED5]|tara:strand:- start:74575 stop:75189 length:615 start_codon:yes stop_codon:yes gene_type:complete
MLNKITAVTRNGMVAGALTLSVALGAFAPSASAEPRQSSSVDVNAIITLFIGTSYTNVRSGPGTGNAVVEVYDPGREVRIYERRGDWARISQPNESARWVYYPLLSQNRPQVAQQATYQNNGNSRQHSQQSNAQNQQPSQNNGNGNGNANGQRDQQPQQNQQQSQPQQSQQQQGNSNQGQQPGNQNDRQDDRAQNQQPDQRHRG